MDRGGDQRQGREIPVVPDPQFDERRDVRGRVDLNLLGGHDRPAALGLDLAHRGLGARVPVAHAIAVRYLEEPVLGDQRADDDRFEEDVVGRWRQARLDAGHERSAFVSAHPVTFLCGYEQHILSAGDVSRDMGHRFRSWAHRSWAHRSRALPEKVRAWRGRRTRPRGGSSWCPPRSSSSPTAASRRSPSPRSPTASASHTAWWRTTTLTWSLSCRRLMRRRSSATTGRGSRPWTR